MWIYTIVYIQHISFRGCYFSQDAYIQSLCVWSDGFRRRCEMRKAGSGIQRNGFQQGENQCNLLGGSFHSVKLVNDFNSFPGPVTSVYIYIYIHIYIYIYIRSKYVDVHILCINIYIFTVYAHIYIYICICICILHICVYTVYIHIYLHTYTHTYIWDKLTHGLARVFDDLRRMILQRIMEYKLCCRIDYGKTSGKHMWTIEFLNPEKMTVNVV